MRSDLVDYLEPHIRILSGYPFASELFSEERGTPLIRIRDLLSHSTNTYFNGSFDPSYLIRDGDILIGMDGDFNVVRWRGGSALLNQRVCKITSRSPALEERYLYHWLEPKLLDIHRQTPQTTVKHLSIKDIQRIALPLPPLAEQRRIAEVLDTVDAAIQATEGLIAKLKQMKAGLLHDLLTRGLDADGNLRDPIAHPERFKDTTLGRVPRAWEVVPIEDKLSGIIDYRGKTPEKTNSGVPLITAKNVREGFIEVEPREYIAEDAFTHWMTRGIPEPGDVLFTTEAPLGNVAPLPNYKVALAQRIITLCTDLSQLDRRFLLWLLTWPPNRRRIEQRSTGSTVLGIKQSVFRKIEFQFPPLGEQKNIAGALDAQEGRIHAEETYLAKLRDLKKGLMVDLLTGRVRVDALKETLP